MTCPIGTPTRLTSRSRISIVVIVVRGKPSHRDFAGGTVSASFPPSEDFQIAPDPPASAYSGDSLLSILHPGQLSTSFQRGRIGPCRRATARTSFFITTCSEQSHKLCRFFTIVPSVSCGFFIDSTVVKVVCTEVFHFNQYR
jgi:hypothetical protein